MIFRLLADVTVVVHFAFVLFVILGGLLTAWRRWIAWIHVPSALWGAWIELTGGICPLTPLENWFRARGGDAVYQSSFVERYLLPVIYPEALTRDVQLVLGGMVVAVNAVIYVWVLTRSVRRSRARAWGAAQRPRP